MIRFLLIALCIMTAFSLALAPALAAGKKVTVSIEGLKYRPDPITIEVGDTIVWTNNDDRDHSVKADDGSFDSGLLRSGKTFSKKFDKPGKYTYGSDPSPRTKGTVVVKEKK
jgi:plastocyanin